MELLAHPTIKTRNGFRDRLYSLPDAPEDAYRQLWARILGQEQSDAILARRIFSWVTFSEHPLTIEDLQHALHLETDPQIWPFDPDDLIPEEELGSVCLGVIALKPRTSVIAFVHHTAEVFFPQFLTSSFATEAQSQIAVACLRYMRLMGSLLGCYLDPSIPLQAYAANHWATHVKKVGSSIILDDVVGFLADNDCLRGAATLLQQTLWTNDQSMSRTRAPVAKNTTSLHMAAYFGLIDVAEKMLFRDRMLVDHSGDGYWTALRWAVINRQSAMVSYLVGQGAETGLIDDQGNNVLMWALGHDQDLSRLGDLNVYDCSVHIGGTYYYRSLEQAAQPYGAVSPDTRTSLEILHFLVTNTLSINTRNIAGLSALAIAAKHRHWELVSHLLYKGADVNSTDERGMTALLWALQPGSERDFVLENINVYGDSCVHIGPHIIVDPSLHEDDSSSEVEFNAERYESMLLLLVGSELYVDAKDRSGRTALSLAAGKGFRNLANLLLKRGADVMNVDNKKLTACEWAILPPVFHRMIINNVNAHDLARPLIGIQYEYRNSYPHFNPSPLEMDESRALLAGHLLEHMRLRVKESTEVDRLTKDLQNMRVQVKNSIWQTFDEIEISKDAKVWMGSPFCLFSRHDKGKHWIQRNLTSPGPPIQEWYTNNSVGGHADAAYGMVTKLSDAESTPTGSPVTWLTAYTSEELRARKYYIRKIERDSRLVTEVFGTKLSREGHEQRKTWSAAEQELETQRALARDYGVSAERCGESLLGCHQLDL